MECRIFQGSKPIAASTTPTRIDSRISRNATASGVPPRKRYRPSLLAGKSLTSLGIDISMARVRVRIIGTAGQMGNPKPCRNGCPPDFLFCAFPSREPGPILLENVMGLLVSGRSRQHPLQRFQAVGLARRLVPAQPVDAGKAHGDARFVPRRALQPLEGDFQNQALVRLMHDMADRTEFLGGVAADETVDLQQLLVGEAEIGLSDRYQLLAVIA